LARPPGPTPSREALMSAHSTGTERFETIVVGGGQAGLSVGYHLRRLGRPFLILDAGERVGDSWRIRWDSLRLFTPAWADALTGMPFPAPRNSFPSKDEMANYLEYYATRFELPVRLGVTVDHLSRRNGRFLVSAGAQRWEADHVVVAMSTWQQPTRPAYAAQLDPNIVQMHSAQYRNPGMYSSWEPATRGQRWRSTSPQLIEHGCRADTPATYRSASRGPWCGRLSSHWSCGCCSTGC
jgi:cation diffusion facilitator CzcD-associated flavoprotein CzcO